MSTLNPDPENQASLREALRRDAARFKEPPFDAALHHATLRRIRALSASPRPEWKWAFACAAVLAFVGIVTLWPVRPSPITPQASRVADAPMRTAQASEWVYLRAAAQSDEALLAMLERDARTLLPETPAVSLLN